MTIMEFSKKLLIFSWVITLILTAVMVYISLKTLPLDGVIVVTPLSWAETATATGFYYWKARTENRAKYAQEFLRDFTKEHNEETAIRIAEIVLKE